MTSSPPSEAPHYRGKSLTPASPIPLHIPEPSNIPVLQNQIDPEFNQMSTHLDQHSSARKGGMSASDAAQRNFSDINYATASSNGADAMLAYGGGLQDDHRSKGNRENGYIMLLENEGGQKQSERESNETLQNHSTSSVLQPTSTIAAYDNRSIPTQTEHPSAPPSHTQNGSGELVQHSLNPYEPPQDTPMTLGPDATTHESPTENNVHVQPLDAEVNGVVNYQALLDNLTPLSAPAPSADNITSITTVAPSEPANAPRPSSVESPLAALPIPAGLPPRPPPQEKPAIHPNYTPGEDIRSYHYPHTQTSNSHSSYSSQPSNSYRPSQGFHPASSATVGANGLPPPPPPTFQQPATKPGQVQRSPLTQQSRQRDSGRNSEKSTLPADEDGDEVPWGPDIERKYAQFLHDEAIYVTEGLWDRFPPGSRLFVGNLYTEKVTKRDLFFMFYPYGRLAQVSIKNAYGFIQYLDANCCSRALQAEQGMSIRGRKMHLEISKPQKNARNATATTAGDSLRAGYSRRSRSPDHSRGPLQRGSGQRGVGDRIDRGVPSSSFRDEPRRSRDDYRPVRSPSPRGFRGRDEYRGGRDRSPDRYYGGRRSRSRSPYNRNGRFRSRSPRNRDPDDESDLPIPRRETRDVPDVQMILVDEVDRTFVAYIEKSFRDRGLRCDALQLPRVSLAAVIKRQMLEGVQAVVKIFRQSQVTGKIPLQVFDRSGGVDNIRFDEYAELDANIAAELVIRAKSTHLKPAPGPAPGPGPYNPAPAYGASQYAQTPQQHLPPQQPQSAGANPNLANLITNMDGPALQKLLGAMAQTPQTPQSAPNLPSQTPQQATQIPDLAALLGNVNRQPPLQQHQGYAYAQQQQSQPNAYPPSTPNSSFASNAALSSLLGNAGNRPSQHSMLNQQQQMQPGQQHHVQNIMEQLARWKQ